MIAVVGCRRGRLHRDPSRFGETSGGIASCSRAHAIAGRPGTGLRSLRSTMSRSATAQRAAGRRGARMSHGPRCPAPPSTGQPLRLAATRRVTMRCDSRATRAARSLRSRPPESRGASTSRWPRSTTPEPPRRRATFGSPAASRGSESMMGFRPRTAKSSSRDSFFAGGARARGSSIRPGDGDHGYESSAVPRGSTPRRRFPEVGVRGRVLPGASRQTNPSPARRERIRHRPSAGRTMR